MEKAQPRLGMYLLLVHRGKVLRESFPSTKYFVALSSPSVYPVSIWYATWTDTEAGCQQDCPLHIFTTVSTVLASQQLALDVFGKTGFSVKSSMGPELAAAVSRKSQVRCQHSLKGMKSVQGRKGGSSSQLLAVCMWSRGWLAITSTGLADRDVKAKICLKHLLCPWLPAAGLCRAACIGPVGTHFSIHFNCQLFFFFLLHVFSCYPGIFFLLSISPPDHVDPVFQFNIAAVQLIKQRPAESTGKHWPPY